MSFAAGTVLMGKYRVDGELGTGGYGTVVRAHHLLAHQEVAIKILRDDVDLDDENRQRFLREAQAMVRLRSEHVAKISDVGTLDSGHPYVVMELLEGMDLGKVLEAAGRLRVQTAADHLLQACDVLAEAHAQGIVHRDIKPTNLFVTRRRDGSSSIKVLDFGISKTSTDEMKLTQTATMLGTPAYMSPEQMRSARTVDARTDIWSLGVVLYELVEGRMPYAATNFAELAVMIATERYAPMQAAPELEPIVARCLGKSADERYPTVAELAADLGQFAAPETAATYVTRICRTLGRPPPRASAGSSMFITQVVRKDRAPAKRKPLLAIAIIGGLVVGGVVVAGIALGGGGAPPAQKIEMKSEPPPAAVPVPAAVPAPVPVPAAAAVPAAAPVPAAGAGSGSGSAKRPPKAQPPKPKCDVFHQFNGKCI